MKIYENILKGKVKYPPYIHHDAQDLLQKLITPDLTRRLGNLHGQSKDVMNHSWFQEVTWDRLARKDIDAPYVPPVKGGVGDASQFDKYPEETEQYGAHGADQEIYNSLSTALADPIQIRSPLHRVLVARTVTDAPLKLASSSFRSLTRHAPWLGGKQVQSCCFET